MKGQCLVVMIMDLVFGGYDNGVIVGGYDNGVSVWWL